MKRKLLSLILAAVLLCSLLPATISFASEETYSGKCGVDLTWSFDADTGTLLINGTGAMDNWILDSSPWHVYGKQILTVIIGDGVTNIGIFAFEGCTGLQSITIPDSVTIICEGAFLNCTSLESIRLPASLFSIEYAAFQDTGYYNNRQNWTDGVLYIGEYLILADDSLTDDYTVRSGTKLIADRAFESCSNLTSVTISEGVSYIGLCAFHECPRLNAVTIPGSVKSIGVQSFRNCTGLVSLTLSEGVTNINGEAFTGCSALCTVTIPNSVTFIGVNAFQDCTSLRTVKLSENLTSINQGTFRGCTGLTEITFPDNLKTIEAYAFYGCSALAAVTIPDGVEAIGNYTFSRCSALTAVSVSDTVSRIGVRCFAECVALTQIKLPNGLTAISDGLFAGCTNLSSITIPSGVKSIGGDAFNNCKAITAIVIPDGVTSIFRGSFYGCTALTTVIVPSTVCSIGESGFCECLGLTDVYYGGTEAEWNEIDIGDYNDSLAAVTIHYESGSFVDVSKSAWYYKAVDYAVENKLMNGVGEGKFAPSESMTRAMLVTVLWRYEGSPKGGTNDFADVPNGLWYTDAVAWASANGIVGGIGGGRFDPDGKVTREQLAAILFRYCKSVGINIDKRGDLSSFPDKAKVSSWANDAYSWAVGEGLIGGNKINGQTLLDPQGNATRAQVATILMRFIQNISDK